MCPIGNLTKNSMRSGMRRFWKQLTRPPMQGSQERLLDRAVRPYSCAASPPIGCMRQHITDPSPSRNEVPGGITAWPRNGNIMPAECHCYLFADDTQTLPSGAVAGACGFRYIKYTDGSSGRRLEWIWLCPAARRKGILERQWARLREENGNFDFEPVIEAMKCFAKKHRPSN